MQGWKVVELAEVWEGCAREDTESGCSFIYARGDTGIFILR